MTTTRRGGHGRWLGAMLALVLGLTLVVALGGLAIRHAAADAEDDANIEAQVAATKADCAATGGWAEVDYDLDIEGHIISVTVTCHNPKGKDEYCTITADAVTCSLGLTRPPVRPGTDSVVSGSHLISGAAPATQTPPVVTSGAPVHRLLTGGVLSSGASSPPPTPSAVMGSVVTSRAANIQSVIPSSTPAATPSA